MKRSAPDSSASTRKKRKRVVLMIEQKRSVIHLLKSGHTVAQVSAQFNVGDQTVRDIKWKEADLHRYVITYPTNKERKTTKRPLNENLDLALYEWFKFQ